MAIEITSSAFEMGGEIPEEHTGDGEDASPPLEWTGVPEGTKELVVTCDDPDAPLPYGWVHWVLYNIPPTTTGLAAGSSGGFVEGPNDFGNQGYGGPMPPPGHGAHQYYFWIYALDAVLDLPPGLTRRELLERIEGHVIEQARLVGTYER